MKQLIAALRRLKKRGPWPIYVLGHEEMLALSGLIGPRVNKKRCLECGGKAQSSSPMYYKHTKACPGVARFHGFWDAIKEFTV